MGNKGILHACLRGDDEIEEKEKKEENIINQYQHSPVKQDVEEDGMGESYEASQNNSFYKSRQIGPYLNVDKSNSYTNKMKAWKQAVQNTPVHGWKEIEEQLEINFKEKYQYCENKLDKALISYYIIDKQHFIDLIKMGPPNNRIRWSCWKLLLIKTKKQISYELCHANNIQKSIAKDIKRTLTQHPFFQSTDNGYTIGHQQLLNVLNSVAYLLPHLGYCQGMNFLAGFFLLISGGNENLSFQCMIQLLTNQRFLMYYMFDDQLELLVYMEYLTEKQMAYYLPDLARFLYKTIEFPNSFWLTKMMLTLFLYNFKLEVCLRLWDYVLSNNIFYVISLVMALLETKQQELLLLQDYCQISEWFQKLCDIDNKTLKRSEFFKITNKQVQVVAAELAKKNPTNKLCQQLTNYPNVKEFLQKDIQFLSQ